MMRTFLVVTLVALGAGAQADERRWLRANFLGHAANDRLLDVGSEPPAALHRALRAAGFDFSVHSAHSTHNSGDDAAEHFRAQRAEEAALEVSGVTTILGEELTVRDGPRHQRHVQILGKSGPGNLDHMTLFGIRELVPSLTTIAEACTRAHRDGGVCIVNHPGPGPMMWEPGYWEAPANRRFIDALEVYNGQAMAAVGIEFEARYLEATAYARLGLKIAAVTGADTHGPESFARARASISRLGTASKLLSLVLPSPSSKRPELDAATLVGVDGRSEEDLAAAVKARRTIATWALPNLRVEVPGVGEVRPARQVALSMSLSRRVEEVTLYREGAAVRTWRNVSDVEFAEHIDRPSAYVFAVRDGHGRLLTSAIWYEPTDAGSQISK
jgi:hypothetical protein